MKKVLYGFLSITLISITFNLFIGCGLSREYAEKDEIEKENFSTEGVGNNKDFPNEKDETTSKEKIETDSLDNKKISWWYVPNKEHKAPDVNSELNYKISDYDAYYLGNTEEKNLYLTFDEGYENGYTSKILDTLKENDVKAAFFVTLPYLEENAELTKRMVDEGHIVANHTSTHPSMPSVANKKENFEKEIMDVEKKFKEITGKDIYKYIRPPKGDYSEKSLAMSKNLRYKSVFWSFAYNDWNVKKQPNPDKAKKIISQSLHNGSIILLHAVSETNADILDSVIKDAKDQGYKFKSLEDSI